MDLLQLKYFQTVAKHEHITRAAEELHIAQPSLSKVITRLEEELGVSLFDRIGRQIKLNRFGKAFLQRVAKAFLELEDGKRELCDMQGNEKPVINLAFNNFYSFAKILTGYAKLYPQTSFRQTIGSTAKMRQQLLNGDIDFGIASPPIEGDSIESIPLFTEEVFLLVPHGHKFANCENIKLMEAAHEPFISLKEGFGLRDLTEGFCRQAGFTPNIAFESDIALNLIDLVNSNLGIALLPIVQWSTLPENLPVALHITEPLCNRTTALSFLQGRYLPQAAKEFEDYLLTYFKQQEQTAAP
ncbi:MAG TPA: LysR family transcriptional regulator [Firmicutes bacterium]|jgi:DNA-binding transcriptional LysR family regulator|nr:LysR family transcriptional regulator [Bacillota bacterium]